MRLAPKLGILITLTAALAAAGCDSDDGGGGSSQPSWVACDDATSVCTLTAPITDPITEDLTLTADKQWLLKGGVFVGDEAGTPTLTLEPGTTVYGETASKAFLTIRRGAKIMADGTKDAPIVFTSSKAAGTRARGDWGGVVINGRAPINGCDAAPCEAEGEGGTGKYGGSSPTDSSGVLRYVRVEFAGNPITEDNELNGIAFQGVGSGTVIDHVQIHMAADDGIEFFGGTASFKYVLTTGISDDNLDWTDGWQGNGQFFVAQQYEDTGDNGIEADNNGENNAATPRSNPKLANLTLIGSPDSKDSDVGILLREGTGATLMNAVVVGWNDVCLDIDQSETWNAGMPTISHSLVNCGTHYEQETWDCAGADADACAADVTIVDGSPKEAWVVEDWFTGEASNAEMGWDDGNRDMVLEGAYDTADPGFAVMSGVGPTPGDPSTLGSFFEAVTFVGGVDPADDWTAGWTTSARN